MRWVVYIIIICAFALLGYLLGSKRAEIDMSSQFEYFEAENATLQRECDSLQIIVKQLEHELKDADIVVDNLEFLIKLNAYNINKIREGREEEMVRLSNAGADSLFRIFTEYLK